MEGTTDSTAKRVQDDGSDGVGRDIGVATLETMMCQLFKSKRTFHLSQLRRGHVLVKFVSATRVIVLDGIVRICSYRAVGCFEFEATKTT